MIEEIDNEPIANARDRGLLKAKYVGKNAELKGKMGGAVFSSGDDSWQFKATGESRFYNVELDDLHIY